MIGFAALRLCVRFSVAAPKKIAIRAYGAPDG